MHQFVESAIEAAKQGDNNKAMAFLKQVLSANPNDIDAWMVLAAVVDDPKQKRQCLSRVLAINPTNQLAREELMEMDRAEGHDPSFNIDSEPGPSSPYYIDTIMEEGEQNNQTSEPRPVELPSSPDQLHELPLVFKYPLVLRIIVYVSLVAPGCLGLIIATRNLMGGILFVALALGMLIASLFLLPTVELNKTGVRVFTTFTSNELSWDEIARARSRKILELTSKSGQSLKISKQLDGYPRIIETLRKMRPDLFKSTRPGTETPPSTPTL